MTMTRQQMRQQERIEKKLAEKVAAFRKASPMAEEVHRRGYEEGWKASMEFFMRVCYASSVRALHEIEGYGRIRNKRFLRRMDYHIINTMTSQEAIDAALLEGGVEISFKESFPEDRVQEA